MSERDAVKALKHLLWAVERLPRTYIITVDYRRKIEDEWLVLDHAVNEAKTLIDALESDQGGADKRDAAAARE